MKVVCLLQVPCRTLKESHPIATWMHKSNAIAGFIPGFIHH
jgi:hypothetical protein